MPRFSRRDLLVLSCAASLNLLPSLTAAQQPRRPRVKADPERKINTKVNVDLISEGGVGLDAQEWAEIFQEMDVTFSVRRSQLDEKPETTEAVSGISLRDVQVLGRLETDGSITFADRRFTRANVAKLREWIDGLKAYGAQGSPKGQPMWGLSKNQFDPLFQALTPVLKIASDGAALNKALELFTVRRTYPFRFTADATQHLERGPVPEQTARNYTGMSEGTALAALLNEFGLGFHPMRTPQSKLELAIVTLGPKANVWPVGWPLSDEPPKVSPNLFKIVEVELDDEPLLDVLQVVGDLIQIPVIVDEYGLKVSGIDPKTKLVSHKKRRTLWSAALKHVCFQARCKWELRVDEGGHPLLWVMSDIPPKDARDEK
ncbi:MAG: hypothetical protein V4719_20890 [Planctomycetota bacterium]